LFSEVNDLSNSSVVLTPKQTPEKNEQKETSQDSTKTVGEKGDAESNRFSKKVIIQ